MQKNKRGQQVMSIIIGIGIGIVVLAMLLGVGTNVLWNLGSNLDAQANATTSYLITQLGQTGLAGWVPTIIAATVGFALIGFFVGRRMLGGR